MSPSRFFGFSVCLCCCASANELTNSKACDARGLSEECTSGSSLLQRKVDKSKLGTAQRHDIDEAAGDPPATTGLQASRIPVPNGGECHKVVPASCEECVLYKHGASGFPCIYAPGKEQCLTEKTALKHAIVTCTSTTTTITTTPEPTPSPTEAPTLEPTPEPTPLPTQAPTAAPTAAPICSGGSGSMSGGGSGSMITVAELNNCLKALGASFHNVVYIEVAYGFTEYLDSICDAFGLGPYAGTAGPDICSSGVVYAQYPGGCGRGWLGSACENGCGHGNYGAFDCHAPR